MSITVENTGKNKVTISLDKTFDFSCTDEFKRSYESLDDCAQNDDTDVFIDLKQTQYMDSSALGMLINMQKHWQKRTTPIRIINPNPEIRKIFTISRFDKKFSIE